MAIYLKKIWYQSNECAIKLALIAQIRTVTNSCFYVFNTKFPGDGSAKKI